MDSTPSTVSPSWTVALCDFPGLLADLVTRGFAGLELTVIEDRAADCTLRWVTHASVVDARIETPPEGTVFVCDTPATSRRLRGSGATAVCARDITIGDLITLARDPLGGRRSAAAAMRAVRRDRPTDRELDVMQLLASGYRNEQIAVALGISPHTVRTHIQRVIVRLGVASRAAAVVRLTEEGLVDSGGAFSA